MVKYSIPIIIGIGLTKILNKDPLQIDIEWFLFYQNAIVFSFQWASINYYQSFSSKFQEKGKTNSNFFILYLIVTGGLAGTLFFILSWYFNLYKPETCLYFSLSILFSHLTTLTEYNLILRRKWKVLSQYFTSTQLIFLLSILLTVYLFKSLNIVVICILLSSIIRFCFSVFVHLRNEFTSNFAYNNHLKKHFLSILPLVGMFVISGSAVYIDGILIDNFLSKEDLLFFRYGGRELPITLLLMNAISLSMIAVVSKNGKENLNKSLDEIKTQVNRIMHIGFPISIVLLIFSRWIFIQFYNEEFISSAYVFDLFLFLIIPRLMLPQSILMGFQKNQLIFRISIVELFIHVVLSILLIPFIGIIGVGIATVFSYFFEKITLLYYCRKLYGINLSSILDLKVFLIYSLTLLVVFIIKMFTY